MMKEEKKKKISGEKREHVDLSFKFLSTLKRPSKRLKELTDWNENETAAAAAAERASSKCFILMHLNIRSQLRI